LIFDQKNGDRPAVIWPDGTRWWYRDGEPHRDGDRPSAIQADGKRRWLKNGEAHREFRSSDLSLACAMRKRLGRVDTEWVRAFTV